MTDYSVTQLHALWDYVGGSDSRWKIMVAIALAESGGDSEAISPQGDYGLWQINRENFAAYGVTADEMLQGLPNAAVAKRMSGNGTNVAAWCTAWANPDADCGRGFLASPQVGSAAYPHLLALNGVGEGAAPPGPGNPPDDIAAPAQSGWSAVQNIAGAWGANQKATYINVANRVNGIYK